MARRRTPEIMAGTLDTLTARIRCAYCDEIYHDPTGSEIVTNTDESFHAMPRTLVCRSCSRRFVKPIPTGWARHPSGLSFMGPARQRPEPGQGKARPNTSHSPGALNLTLRTAETRKDAGRRYEPPYVRRVSRTDG